MNIALACFTLAALLAVYFLVIRPRGASLVAAYREGGLAAVFSGFMSWWAGIGGVLALALPDLLTLASGVDFKTMLPDPWGAWVATGVSVSVILLRAYATTPAGDPPSGEA